jgi:hypothetical protein
MKELDMSKKWKQRNQGLAANVAAPQEAPAAQEAAAQEPLVEFNAWFASRSKKIPAQHHREVLKADFKARGLGAMASMEDFDQALRKYGIKLD